ncbi:unnamed protein product [Fraxinus pennsylvanica]|uniref:Mediator of RNA polymerase II transcription subunit 10 n=1 Tax=Fraxinus pennsylvanica TaxID=56036 RepID=A0AAD2DU66_9LAMI|nr:unnamed protein product [Fraxinus pennsylvanica]
MLFLIILEIVDNFVSALVVRLDQRSGFSVLRLEGYAKLILISTHGLLKGRCQSYRRFKAKLNHPSHQPARPHCLLEQHGSQLRLLRAMNNLVLELDSMTKFVENCNIQVPMEVINLIDDGKNPDEFTLDVLNSCIPKNQIIKGKTDTFKSLRSHLLEELEQTFPDEVEVYTEIHAAFAERKRFAQAESTLPNGDAKVNKLSCENH